MGKWSSFYSAFFRLIVIAIFAFTFSGCEYSDYGSSGTAVPNLAVNGLPSDISSVTLIVSGPGMNNIEVNYTPPPTTTTGTYVVYHGFVHPVSPRLQGLCHLTITKVLPMRPCCFDLIYQFRAPIKIRKIMHCFRCGVRCARVQATKYLKDIVKGFLFLKPSVILRIIYW